MKEIWTNCDAFPEYDVSNYGYIRKRDGKFIKSSVTQDGTVKVNVHLDGQLYTRSLRRIIADQFVERFDERSDTVICLDGNQTNLAADNLAWRPRWFAWQYARQFHKPANEKYHVPVQNMHTGHSYASVVDAGMTEGLLFKDVYRSAVTGSLCYPHGCRFEAL